MEGRVLIAENGHDYVRVEIERPRRSWVWWLALTGAAAWIGAAIWISYRALMGWPVPGIGLLTRLGG
jgi:hypothetical protein